jgi:hypothetical protein
MMHTLHKNTAMPAARHGLQADLISAHGHEGRGGALLVLGALQALP